MTFLRSLMATAAATAMCSAMANAEPAIIFDLGGKFDGSFNEAGYNGAERWKAETGGNYSEFVLDEEAQREQALRRLAERGSNPVVTLGFSAASTLEQIAPEYPDTSFIAIDAFVDLPNVRNYAFAEHEGSFLVGIMAAMASKSGTVGFVGGMDVPLIRKFACGYVQGVRAANPDAVIIQSYTGSTPEAWNNPTSGGEQTRAMVSRGADVVYHAAGGTGVGVLQAAADEGILGIGVDSNQNGLHPGSILTSMIKRVDNAVYESFSDSTDEVFDNSNRVMDLASEGVGYAMDDNNKDLVTDEMIAAVEDAKAKIIAGEISVHNYESDSACPVE